MKTILLFIIVILLGVIAYFLYEDHKKTPAEKAAEEFRESVEGVAKEFEGIFKK